MAEFSIFSYALSASQVASLYSASAVPGGAPACEVFVLAQAVYSQATFAAGCAAVGARPATYAEVSEAQVRGASWCYWAWFNETNYMGYPVNAPDSICATGGAAQVWTNTKDCAAGIRADHCGNLVSTLTGATCVGVKPVQGTAYMMNWRSGGAYNDPQASADKCTVVIPSPPPSPPPPSPPPLPPSPFGNTAAAAFSLRVVVPSYSGPVVNVRNGATGATQDFYAVSQSGGKFWDLMTAPGGSGGSLSCWLGGASAFVTTWCGQL